MSEYVLDASVAVATLRPTEPHHAAAQAYVRPLLTGADSIVVPALFGIEVAASLARVGFPDADALKFSKLFLENARIVTLGPRSSKSVAALAAQTKLRAGDALYLWVAIKEGLPLITADAEILSRGKVVWKDIHLPT